jgi:diguanylate cyclase (GGDEF)-like protein
VLGPLALFAFASDDGETPATGEVPAGPTAPAGPEQPAEPATPATGSTEPTGSQDDPSSDDSGGTSEPQPQSQDPQSDPADSAPAETPRTPEADAPSGTVVTDGNKEGRRAAKVAKIAAAVSAPQTGVIRPAVVDVAASSERKPKQGDSGSKAGNQQLKERTTIARAVDGIPLPFRAALLLLIFVSSVLAIVSLRERRRSSAVARVAQLDRLTGLANREGFDRQMAIEWQRALRHGRALGLVFVDLDDFKDFNDTYGHVAGDRLLREVAAAITATSRGSDFTARLGGDEFVVICPDTDADGLDRLVERLRVEAAGMAVTLSIGSANRQSSDLGPDELVHRADIAMYSAKPGRGRMAPSSNPMLGSLRRS